MKTAEVEKLARMFRAMDDKTLGAYVACLIHEYAAREGQTMEWTFARLAQISRASLGERFYEVPPK